MAEGPVYPNVNTLTWLFGHVTAEANVDLQSLIASVGSFGGPAILVPSRNSALLRWCLLNGLRVIQPMSLNEYWAYNEPVGAWSASLVFNRFPEIMLSTPGLRDRALFDSASSPPLLSYDRRRYEDGDS